jgi:hypothetical protein
MRISPPRRSSSALGAADSAAPSQSVAPAPARTPRGPAEGAPSLQGRLDQLGLSTLLTVLDMERWSGVLVIRRRGAVGRLWLGRGRVWRASIDGSLRLSGKVAAFDLLAWGEGRFELTREEVDGNDEIDTPTTHLLMEAARRVDEAGAVLLY